MDLQNLFFAKFENLLVLKQEFVMSVRGSRKNYPACLTSLGNIWCPPNLYQFVLIVWHQFLSLLRFIIFANIYNTRGRFIFIYCHWKVNIVFISYTVFFQRYFLHINIGITRQLLLNYLQNHHLVQEKFCYLL